MPDYRKLARAALASLVMFCGAAGAATLTVTNTADSGAGSLRNALASAAAGDIVVFAPGVTGAIALASTLTIAQPVTIQGPGAALLALDGQSTVGVIDVTAGSLALSGVTIVHGKSATLGGGIHNAGTLNVSNAVFDANVAPNGGAIANISGATLTVDTTTFRNNSASGVGGGAIINIGTATVTASTFSTNAAPVNGGAINNQPAGSLTVINSTFTANSSSSLGGALSNLGTLHVYDSTIAGNTSTGGSAIATGNANVTTVNSVYADNTVNAFTPTAGSVTGSFNVFHSNGSPADDQAGYGTTSFVYAPNEPLGSLANNGGPTPTMMPLTNQAAICAGSVALLPSGVTTDQRGMPRTTQRGGTACLDAGAVQSAQQAPVPTLSEFALVLLGGLLLAFGAGVAQRRSARSCAS